MSTTRGAAWRVVAKKKAQRAAAAVLPKGMVVISLGRGTCARRAKGTRHTLPPHDTHMTVMLRFILVTGTLNRAVTRALYRPASSNNKAGRASWRFRAAISFRASPSLRSEEQ